VLLGQRLDVRPALRPAARRDARCVGPTSAISLPRTSTRASSVPGRVKRLRAFVAREVACFHGRASRFGGSHDSPRIQHGGRCLPVGLRAHRAYDAPVASPGDPRALARLRTSRGPPRPIPTRSRERARRSGGLERLPSTEDPRPATPSRTSGSDLPELRGLATVVLAIDAFGSPRALAGLLGVWSPSTRPVATGTALVWTSASLADFCNRYDARAHPTSRRSSPASGGFRPTARRRPRAPVALAFRVRHRIRGQRAANCSPGLAPRRSACADGADHGSGRLSEGERALLTMSRGPSSGTLRAPGSPACLAPRPGGPRRSTCRPRPPSDGASRKEPPSRRSGCFLPQRNPYTSGGLLLRARLDRVPFTPPPGGGIARGSPRL